MLRIPLVVVLLVAAGTSFSGAASDAKTPSADAPSSNAPPVVGRPPEFSGAIGGPLIVRWLVEPTEVEVEAPVTLTLQITGQGNLADMPRPAIAKLDSFKPFAIDDLDDRFVPGNPPRREFRWRVRARTAEVTEIPRFKFVYFNPHIVPVTRGYQTTYADAVTLKITDRPRAATKERPVDAPKRRTAAPSVNPWRLIVALIAPPMFCALWFVVWRHTRPNAARLAAARSSRAASVAIRALDRSGNRAEAIQSAVIGFLRDRIGLPRHATTPTEIATELAIRNQSELSNLTMSIFRRCDALRFSPSMSKDDALVEDARQLIADWERVL